MSYNNKKDQSRTTMYSEKSLNLRMRASLNEEQCLTAFGDIASKCRETHPSVKEGGSLAF